MKIKSILYKMEILLKLIGRSYIKPQQFAGESKHALDGAHFFQSDAMTALRTVRLKKSWKKRYCNYPIVDKT